MGVYGAVEYCAASGLILIEDAFELESWDESFWIRIEIAHIDTVKPNTAYSSRYDFFLNKVNVILAECVCFKKLERPDELRSHSRQTAAKSKY